MADAFMSDPVYALGERVSTVHDTAAAGLLLSEPAELAAVGFGWHHVCGPKTSAYDLAAAAVRQLAESGRLDRIDAVIYATCIPLNGNAGEQANWARTGDVKHLMDFPGSRIQDAFDLEGAVVIGLSQQACTAMLSSVDVARGMLAVETDWQRILCVTADRFPEGSRYEQAYNLISDGAAACVVDRRAGQLRVLSSHHITNGALGRADDDETVGSYFPFTRRVIETALGKAGLAPSDLAWVVTQNTNANVWRILARVLGMDPERFWAPSLAEVGHVIAADPLVNLSRLLESGRLRPGDRLALVMAGFGLNWHCLLLEATEAVTDR